MLAPRSLVAHATLALVTLAAGCSSGPPITVDATTPEIARGTPEKSPGISVAAQGKASGAPDLLRIDIGVSVLRATVSQAIADATQRANALRDAALAAGIRNEDVQTANYSISPEYDPDPKVTGERKIIGQRVTYTLALELRDFKRAGEAIDAVTKAGGSDVTVNGLRFAIEKPEKLQAKAREQAWREAEAKANQLASLAGVRLGAPTTIVEGGGAPPVPLYFARSADMAAGAAAPMAPPIEPGQLDVVVNLDVQFAIDGPTR